MVVGKFIDPSAAQIEDRIGGDVLPAVGDVIAFKGGGAPRADVDGGFIIEAQGVA